MRRWLVWVAIIACLTAAVTLDARPGGGETYSSGLAAAGRLATVGAAAAVAATATWRC